MLLKRGAGRGEARVLVGSGAAHSFQSYQCVISVSCLNKSDTDFVSRLLFVLTVRVVLFFSRV